MPTQFGKFISGKFFSKLFLILYVLFMCFAAYETNTALCFLSGRTHLFGAVYTVFAIVAVLILTKKKISAKWYSKIHKKITSFLSCFFIYYLFALLVWELVSVVFSVAPKVKAIGIIGSIVLSAFIVLYGYLRTKVIKIKPYDISLRNDGQEYRIALMSDIHLGIFVGEKHIKRIVRKINELSPDLVVISGDIFDVDNSLLNDSVQLKRISKQFSKIKATEGVYAVVGNHDPEISNKEFKHFLKTAKIRLLDNDAKVLSLLNLVGRTDEANNQRTELVDILAKTDPNKPIVVLDHKPQVIDDNAQNGADLVLCGHTHRGQLFPITVFTKWANGKKYFYGHKLFGKTHAIITSGVGYFELPVRIGSSNEIVDIHLQV